MTRRAVRGGRRGEVVRKRVRPLGILLLAAVAGPAGADDKEDAAVKVFAGLDERPSRVPSPVVSLLRCLTGNSRGTSRR